MMNNILLIILVISQSLHSYSQPPQTAASSSRPRPRPKVDDAPEFARWLVAACEWGVLATLNFTEPPFGNVVSYTDAGVGTPYFYLSTLDPTANLAREDPRASFSISEAELGDCAGKDPQSPLCSRITLSGDLLKLEERVGEGKFALQALFEAHPQFTGFPMMNRTFFVFKLDIRTIFLVNQAAPPANLSIHDYFAVELSV